MTGSGRIVTAIVVATYVSRVERSAEGVPNHPVFGWLKPGDSARLRIEAERNEIQQQRLREQTVRLRRAQEETVRVLAAAVELRDGYTGAHIRRVAAYATTLYDVVAPGRLVYEEAIGFTVHDIGKLGIPDAILLKPGPLTRVEERVMRKHPIMGAALIQNLDFLRGSVHLVRHHHERWDGFGYPDGLRRRDTPLAARVFSVADSFDAATTNRPYRPARSTDEAVASIVAMSGTAYDPEVVEAFQFAVGAGRLNVK